MASGASSSPSTWVEHNLHVDTAEGQRRSIPLVSRTVAAFYAEYRAVLRALALDLHFWTTPVEIPDPIPFEEDYSHGTYDPAAVRTFFEVLARADLALKEFQGRFTGKQSPVHFFWGSFDLAAARYSGRRAPERPGADTITKEGYSHEELAFGFWPGAAGILDATFYAYAAPEPPGFKGATVRPPAARYHPPLGEFVLPYEELRHESDPHRALLEFFQSAYDAGAALGRWDRASLDRPMPAESGRQPGA